MCPDIEERLRHDFRDASSNSFALGLRLNKSCLECSLNVGKPLSIGHRRTRSDSIRNLSQVDTGAVRHTRDPFKRSLFVGFLWLIELLLKHLDEASLYLSKVVKVDLLTNKLLPDNARQIQDHLRTSSDTDPHEHTEELILVQVGGWSLVWVQHKFVLAFLLVVQLVSAR